MFIFIFFVQLRNHTLAFDSERIKARVYYYNNREVEVNGCMPGLK